MFSQVSITTQICKPSDENGEFLSGAVVALLLEEDWETVVADPHGLGGGGEGQLVVAARVAEYLPARATVMLYNRVL